MLLLFFVGSRPTVVTPPTPPAGPSFGHRRGDDPTPGLAKSTGRRGSAATPTPISPGGG